MQGLEFYGLIFTRMIASIVFGFGIGLERELTNKYAGLRTNMLVCLGSCIFTILSIYAFPMAVDNTDPQAFGDPARIAAQILTGIGFIGGGTVLRHGSSVHGLTTAATLWVAAAIGMACGAGMLQIALIATLFSITVLVLIRAFEFNVLAGGVKALEKLKITLHCDNTQTEQVHQYIIENITNLNEISKKISTEKENLTQITAIVSVKGEKQKQSLCKKLEELQGLKDFSINEYTE